MAMAADSVTSLLRFAHAQSVLCNPHDAGVAHHRHFDLLHPPRTGAGQNPVAGGEIFHRQTAIQRLHIGVPINMP